MNNTPDNPNNSPEVTFDPIIRPDIVVCQPKNGYRFTIDSVVLAHFARVRRIDRVVEPGSGSGIISALLAKLKGVRNITAIEMQEGMFSCLKRTLAECGIEDVVTPHNADIRTWKQEEPFDVCVCNPPYRKHGTGLLPDRGDYRLAARFSGEMELADLLQFCKRSVKYGGTLFFSYDADMLSDAMSICRAHRFEPKRMQLVYPTLDKRPKIVLLECRYGGGVEMLVEPPLIQEEVERPDNWLYSQIQSGSWQVGT